MLTNAGSATPTFPFTGTVSYNPGGTFAVAAGQSVSFVRDSTVDWNFQEGTVPGYQFTSVRLHVADGLSTFNGTSAPVGTPVTFTSNVLIIGEPGPGRQGHLHVHQHPQRRGPDRAQADGRRRGQLPGHRDGTGRQVTDLTATTTEEGVPVEACTAAPVACDVVDNPASFPASYTVAETLPAATGAGSWAVTAFDCNGVVPAGGHDPDGRGDVQSREPGLHLHQHVHADGQHHPHQDDHRRHRHHRVLGHPRRRRRPGGDTSDPVYSATTTGRGAR